MALVLTDPKNYHNIAEAIRETTGSSETFAPAEMADAIRAGGGGGGKLDHTVTFIDTNNKVVAIFSVTDGTGVDAPTGVNADKWVDENGTETILPFIPINDCTLNAVNVSITDLIYEKQGVDRNAYPYFVMWNVSNAYNSSIMLCFSNSISKQANSTIISLGKHVLHKDETAKTNDTAEKALQHAINDVIPYSQASDAANRNANIATFIISNSPNVLGSIVTFVE